MGSQRSIVVVRGGAIGDFILTLPVLAALRRHFPGYPIHILGYPRIASLALAGNLAERVDSIEAPALAAFFVRDGVLPPEWQSYFASAEVVISFAFDPDRVFQGNVLRCGPGRFLAGMHRPHECGGMHATDAFLQPLRHLGIDDPDPVPRLVLKPIVAPDLSSGRIALHPGSGSERKNWPEPKWSQLLQGLAARASRLLVISGEAEEGKVMRLLGGLPQEQILLVDNRPLVEVAERLASCKFFIGHDSGITHLAAALGLPGVILWGPTNPQVWRPRSDAMVLLSDPRGLMELPVERVMAAVSQWEKGTATTDEHGVRRSGT